MEHFACSGVAQHSTPTCSIPSILRCTPTATMQRIFLAAVYTTPRSRLQTGACRQGRGNTIGERVMARRDPTAVTVTTTAKAGADARARATTGVLALRTTAHIQDELLQEGGVSCDSWTSTYTSPASRRSCCCRLQSPNQHRLLACTEDCPGGRQGPDDVLLRCVCRSTQTGTSLLLS